MEGVPEGGLVLAAELEKYCVGKIHPVLICDDVYTTGNSMETHRAGRENVIGAVIFARKKITQPWIQCLFQMVSDIDW